MENEMKKDIVAIASTDAKTLAAAVTAAGLVETLQGEGPFTVFAPTDAAFADIQSSVDTLLQPENKSELANRKANSLSLLLNLILAILYFDKSNF